jgi:hypothetical protein
MAPTSRPIVSVLAFLLLACGLILDSVAHGRREIKRLAYLSLPAIRNHCEPAVPAPTGLPSRCFPILP